MGINALLRNFSVYMEKLSAKVEQRTEAIKLETEAESEKRKLEYLHTMHELQQDIDKFYKDHGITPGSEDDPMVQLERFKRSP